MRVKFINTDKNNSCEFTWYGNLTLKENSVYLPNNDDTHIMLGLVLTAIKDLIHDTTACMRLDDDENLLLQLNDAPISIVLTA